MFRDPTLKPEIAKKRSKGVKIDIQYNDDGEGVSEEYVQLVSYLGMLAWIMVPLYHTNWRVVDSCPLGVSADLCPSSAPWLR